MRRKIHWKTVFVSLLFSVSVLSLSVVVFSSICLTYNGTIFLFVNIELISYSLIYLIDRYKKMIG